MASVTFYFDVGSPYAYLAAERVQALMAEPVRWQPVLLGGIFRATGRSSWALGDAQRRAFGMAEIERRAQLYGLPPLRWPDPWPSDYLTAMLATTFAFDAGRGHDFTMQAFRNAFQRGWDLAIGEHVLETGEEVGLDRGELEAACAGREVKQALRDATATALELGVIGVPTVTVDGEPFWGDDRLPDAAARLQRPRPPR